MAFRTWENQKIRPSVGCGENSAPSTAVRGYDLRKPRGHLGNIGLNKIADGLGIDNAVLDEKIRSSEAVAQLAVDYNLSQIHGVAGSPTFIMNDGRQKLFGNVGYRLIEANVQELLRSASEEEASWC